MQDDAAETKRKMASMRPEDWPEPIRKALHQLEEAVAAAEAERERLVARCRTLEQALAEAAEARRADQAAAQRRIGALEAELAGLKRQCAKAREELDRLMADLAPLLSEETV